MDKSERQRRRALRQELKTKARTEFEASIPAPKADILDLFYYLENGEPCDNTLRQTVEFIRERGLPEAEMVAWLEQHSGFCDCEVLFNVEDDWNQMVEEEWRRRNSDQEE
jgi:hypothetical protein